MEKMHRITSTIVLCCFLCTTAVSDLAFSQALDYKIASDTLAAASRFDDLTDPEIYDISRIRFILEQHLIAAFGNDKAAPINQDGLIEAINKYADSDKQSPVRFTKVGSPSHMLCLRCRIAPSKGNVGIKTYYAVFPSTASNGGFLIEVYTEKNWKKKKGEEEIGEGKVPGRAEHKAGEQAGKDPADAAVKSGETKSRSFSEPQYAAVIAAVLEETVTRSSELKASYDNESDLTLYCQQLIKDGILKIISAPDAPEAEYEITDDGLAKIEERILADRISLVRLNVLLKFVGGNIEFNLGRYIDECDSVLKALHLDDYYKKDIANLAKMIWDDITMWVDEGIVGEVGRGEHVMPEAFSSRSTRDDAEGVQIMFESGDEGKDRIRDRMLEHRIDASRLSALKVVDLNVDEHRRAVNQYTDNAISNSQIVSAVKNAFAVPERTMKGIVARMLEHMKSGLKGLMSSLEMIPAFVGIPDGTEEGEYFGVDVGGSTLRVVRVQLDGQGNINVKSEKKIDFTAAQKTGPGDQLFDFITQFVKDFMDEQKIGSDTQVDLGLTWSFPVEQTRIDSGIHLKEKLKGWDFKDIYGKDVVQLFRAALERKSLTHVHITALCNDTVGTLAAAAYQFREKGYKVHGLILGTGTNAATYLPLDEIEKLDKAAFFDYMKEMAVNTEWGAFDGVAQEAWDILVDAMSNNPKEHIFEKMISGMYIGEVTQHMLQNLISRGMLFRGESSFAFDIPGGFKTEYMSAIEADESVELEHTRIILNALGITNSILEDRKLVKKICKIVSARAARMSAAAMVALIEITDPEVAHGHILAIDGSLYEKYFKFSKNIERALKEMLGEKASRVKVKLIKDGSGIGAAVIAAVAKKEKALAEAMKNRESGVGSLFATIMANVGAFEKLAFNVKIKLFHDLELIIGVYYDEEEEPFDEKDYVRLRQDRPSWRLPETAHKLREAISREEISRLVDMRTELREKVLQAGIEGHSGQGGFAPVRHTLLSDEIVALLVNGDYDKIAERVGHLYTMIDRINRRDVPQPHDADLMAKSRSALRTIALAVAGSEKREIFLNSLPYRLLDRDAKEKFSASVASEEVTAIEPDATAAAEEIAKQAKGFYNFILPAEFCTLDELTSDKKRSAFDYVRVKRGRTLKEFITDAVNAAQKRENESIVLIPKRLLTDGLENNTQELSRLKSIGVRFIIADLATQKTTHYDTVKERKTAQQQFRLNTYAVMFLTRHIDQGMQGTAAYRLLDFYLKTHFNLSGVTPADYINAVVGNDIVKLVHVYLNYRPIKRYDALERYHEISETLISA